MTPDEFIQLRKGLGYDTRESVANEIGVSKETVKAWELGKNPVPKYAIKALKHIRIARNRRSGRRAQSRE